jgi:hypothetical protein
MKPRMLGQPGAHLRVLVGSVIVDDQMQIEMFRGLAIDPLQETEPLLMPVLLGQQRDDFASR